jgi:hypothetical protein
VRIVECPLLIGEGKTWGDKLGPIHFVHWVRTIAEKGELRLALWGDLNGPARLNLERFESGEKIESSWSYQRVGGSTLYWRIALEL